LSGGRCGLIEEEEKKLYSEFNI